MKRLFTKSEFENAKSNDDLKMECLHCSKIFLTRKATIVAAEKGSKSNACKFCSRLCKGLSQKTEVELSCLNCNKIFLRNKSYASRTNNSFCSRSCSASFNNRNKKHGTRRSKLEGWLEEQLIVAYPSLEIHFNRKDAINSELDIYIPELKLAFELNGIYHYEAIHGSEKLAQVQNNDDRKFQACLEKEIELCIIDTSSFGYFKEKFAQKYFDIVALIIDNKLAN